MLKNSNTSQWILRKQRYSKSKLAFFYKLSGTFSTLIKINNNKVIHFGPQKIRKKKKKKGNRKTTTVIKTGTMTAILMTKKISNGERTKRMRNLNLFFCRIYGGEKKEVWIVDNF